MAYSTPSYLLLPILLTTLVTIPFFIYYTLSFTTSYLRIQADESKPRQIRIRLYLALTSLLYLLHLMVAAISTAMRYTGMIQFSAGTMERYIQSFANLFRFIALALLFPALVGEGWCVCLPASWRREGPLSHKGFKWGGRALLGMMVVMGVLATFFSNVEGLEHAGNALRVAVEAGVLVGVVGVLAMFLGGLVVNVVREKARKERIRRSLERVVMRENIVRVGPGGPENINSGDNVVGSGEVVGEGRAHARVLSTTSVETTQTLTLGEEEEIEHDEEIREMDKMLRKRKRHMLLRIVMPAVMLVTVVYVGEAAVEGGDAIRTKESVVKMGFVFLGWCLALLGFRMGFG